MSRSFLIGAVAVLAGVAAIVNLLTRGAFDERQHERFQSALWNLRQLDATFKEDLLRARFGMLQTYDDFVANHDAQVAALAVLRDVPGFADDARSELDQRHATHVALLDERQAQVEHFKSQNAVVANSRRYVPLAVQQMVLMLGDRPEERELDWQVHGLVRALLGLESGDESAAEQGRTRVGMIQGWAENHRDHPLAAAADNLARHAATLIDGSARLDALTGAILAVPTAQSAKALQDAYEMEVGQTLSRADQYRLMFYGACALLLAVLIGILLALRAANRRLEQHVEQRTTELAASELRFRTLAAAAPIGIFLTDAHGRTLYTNAYWQEVSGLRAEEALGEGWRRALHPDDAAVAEEWVRAAAAGQPYDREFRFQLPDGGTRLVHVRTTVVRGVGDVLSGHVGTLEDVTERKRIAAELQQAQKLESVGRLAAGVAHEINTPVQFVNDSCHFLNDGLRDLQDVLDEYRRTLRALCEGAMDGASAQAHLAAAEERADIAYLLENLPNAMHCSLDGLQRVATIVRSMKEFAHPDQKQKVLADINRAVQSTLTIARNEYKYVADLKTEFGELPPVPCFVGDLNQAVLNIVVNAAHAIEEKVKDTGSKGLITVRTAKVGDSVQISIEDSGCGIPDHMRIRIFDPFFTTKPVGKGTGQGLSIARSVVVEKHGGTLKVDSTPGRGTTFMIQLPLNSPTHMPMEAAA